MITVLPESRLGKWSLGLTAAFILMFALHQALSAFVRRNPEPNPGPPSSAIVDAVAVGYVVGVAGLVTGILSLVKSKERSILVFFVVAALGLAAIFFLLEWFLGR